MGSNKLGRTIVERGLRFNGQKFTRRKTASKTKLQIISDNSPLSDARVEMIDEAGDPILFENYDLNPLGVYLYSDFLLFEGEELNLRLQLPASDEPIRVAAKVDYANINANPGMGLSFTDLGAKEEARLQEYVSDQQKKNAK